MDKTCQIEKLKIDTLEWKLEQLGIQDQKLCKEITLLKKKMEDIKQNKEEEATRSNEEILSLKDQCQYGTST